MQNIAAIDIGYRNLKVSVREGRSQPREFHFPSLAVPSSGVASATAGLTHRDTRLVAVDGQNYEVGPDARLLLGPRSTQVLHEGFIHTPEYRALLLGALSYMGLSHLDVLVGGLPVRHLESGKADLEALMTGPHEVPGLGQVSVGRVLVVPQPLGGLYHHMRLSKEASKQEVSLLIDPGFFTLDWTCAEGLKHLPSLTGSFPAGVSVGLQAAAEYIGEVLKTPFSDLDTLDRKLQQGELRLAGKSFDKARIEEVIREALRPGIVEMRNRIGSALSIDRIVLSGGGAAYYEPLVREAWPHLPVTLLEEPVLANVRGFQAMAWNLLRPVGQVAAA